MASDDVWERLFGKLAELGVDERAFKAAADEGIDGLRRLFARYITFPGERRYSPRDLYERTGVDEDTARALWRAMGFPIVPEDEVAFTDADAEALVIATKLFEAAGMDNTIVLQQARSMGQAAARIAASHQDVIAGIFPEDDPARAAEQALRMAEQSLPTLDRLLVYMYRRHLAAATEQRLMVTPSEEGGVAMSVGFADLSGFTAMSQELDVRELAALIDRFNGTTSDVVAQVGGRVIKTIGDEVMFATPDAASAAEIALRLIGEAPNDGLPALKIGLASGQVIPSEGDLFGSPVNLASRLVSTAKPGSALVDEATRTELGGDDRFVFTSIGRRFMKGFGHVRAFRLRGPEAARARRRR
jgi:adenylate cyclase